MSHTAAENCRPEEFDPTSFVPIEDQIELRRSEQPLTQEWTWESLRNLVKEMGWIIAASQINAALAAAKEVDKVSRRVEAGLRKQLAAEREHAQSINDDLIATNSSLRTALAAEREKMKPLVDALEGIRNHADGHNRNHCLGCSFSFNTATDALVKMKEGK
jgi:hypothetical protein